MAEFEVAKRFSAPAYKVWDYVSWQGMPQLVEGGFFTEADFPYGDAPLPGMLRRVKGSEGAPFVERLEKYIAQDYFYRYSLVDTGDLPVTDYVGTVKVTPAGTGSCLKFGHTATVVGCEKSEWMEIWLRIENEVFEYIRRCVE